MDLNKFVGRVENMLFDICGCNKEEAKIVLEICLKELDLTKEQKAGIRKKREEIYNKYLEEEYNKKIEE